MATASQVLHRDKRQFGETQPGLVRMEPGGRVSACMGCGAVINDQYILRVAPDMEWHAACLKCVECQQFLDETCTCFVRDGKTYCKGDYVRLFGAKCDKCGSVFTRTDMVMRARSKIFHLDCFRCRCCGKQLLPGDEFALREDGLFCRYDFDAIKEETRDHEMTDDNHNTDPTCPVQLAGESWRRDTSGRVHKSEGKPTRIRTVLTEKQLHTLRTCYAANPRPDALMKEQLVEMTGLSPRVVRVWFQNKRCKDKKRAQFLKQAALQQEKSGRFGAYGAMQGIPLVASPPVHAEAAPTPLDVTAYQPPWKSLTEFALAHDLERLDPSHPQYQHMIQQMHGYGVEQDHALAHHQLPQYMEEGGPPMGHPYSHPSSNPSAQFPGTPSELSSTSSD
ncbi:insulin gene enhancer protein ISL-1-like [Penaeus monodon]|uniref:insulin gene enhancer protein ISL-1-like n=1 Tax=Penaeus monodon TaxID=6687 RepID=UPI0018A7A132|nr:insulin gene enhancer protein ISL-1-like [Penaeus monodon]